MLNLVGEIIIKNFNYFKKSFSKYYKYYSVEIGIISIFLAVLFALFDVRYFAYNNIILTIIITLFIFIALFIHYYIWRINNFFPIKISLSSFLLITGENDNYLSMDISKLVVPSEDYLLMELHCKFSEFMRDELNKSKNYTILFKKPNDLEIKLKKYDEKNVTIKDDGLNSPFYCINFKYKNTSKVQHLFELQADSSAEGSLEIYFHSDVIREKYNNFTSKKDTVYSEDLHLRDIEINKDNVITIDRT